MTDKAFIKKDWADTLKAARNFYRIFVPVREGDFHNFRPLEDETIPNFDFFNTRLSPKSIVYPQSERMFECLNDPENPEKGILKETAKDYTPQAIIGIRPCDAQAFRIVKLNFDNPEYRDPWWVQRFESTILVGLGCNAPCPTCFCSSVGGGPFKEEFLDVILYDLGDRYLAKGLTEKGKEFISKTKGGTPADDKVMKEASSIAAAAQDKVTADIPSDKLGEKRSLHFSMPRSGRRWHSPASTAVRAHSCAPHAGALTYRTRHAENRSTG